MIDKSVKNLGYAGDLTPLQTWQLLSDDPSAVVIDVRTPEEWSYVGVPNLDNLKRGLYFVPWAFYPRMSPNPDFIEDVKREACPKSDTPLLFLCRSGVRSLHAARALTDAGFSECYNILGGFEGDADETQHRGTLNGWKVDGLAWVQK